MGRSVPSVSRRVEFRFSQWDKFRSLLNPREQEAFEKLIALSKNRRSAIQEADEPDVAISILLSAIVYMLGKDV